MSSAPERFEVSASSVTITWDDGERTVLDATVLREVCPCAGCRDGGPDVLVPGSGPATIADARMVGGYAINFTFADGHGTGIYPFSMLRSLDPSS